MKPPHCEKPAELLAEDHIVELEGQLDAALDRIVELTEEHDKCAGRQRLMAARHKVKLERLDGLVWRSDGMLRDEVVRWSKTHYKLEASEAVVKAQAAQIAELKQQLAKALGMGLKP